MKGLFKLITNRVLRVDCCIISMRLSQDLRVRQERVTQSVGENEAVYPFTLPLPVKSLLCVNRELDRHSLFPFKLTIYKGKQTISELLHI